MHRSVFATLEKKIVSGKTSQCPKRILKQKKRKIFHLRANHAWRKKWKIVLFFFLLHNSLSREFFGFRDHCRLPAGLITGTHTKRHTDVLRSLPALVRN